MTLLIAEMKSIKPILRDIIRNRLSRKPLLKDTTFIFPNAVLVGQVEVGKASSVWGNVVMRADVNAITVGERSNVQDGSIVHCSGPWKDSAGFPTVIGDGVSIGHGAVIHGCAIGNDVLIGMGSIVMDGAVVEDRVIVGAGSLVPQGKKLSAGLWVGSPAKRVRDLTEDEVNDIRENAEHYVELAHLYAGAQKDG